MQVHIPLPHTSCIEATRVFMPRGEKGRACPKSDSQMPAQDWADNSRSGERSGQARARTEQNKALLTTAEPSITAGLGPGWCIDHLSNYHSSGVENPLKKME